jgi:hypothetical protein
MPSRISRTPERSRAQRRPDRRSNQGIRRYLALGQNLRRRISGDSRNRHRPSSSNEYFFVCNCVGNAFSCTRICLPNPFGTSQRIDFSCSVYIAIQRILFDAMNNSSYSIRSHNRVNAFCFRLIG